MRELQFFPGFSSIVYTKEKFERDGGENYEGMIPDPSVACLYAGCWSQADIDDSRRNR